MSRASRARDGWRRLPASEISWAPITYTRTLWGVDPRGVDAVRAALAHTLAQTPAFCRDIDRDSLTWRPLSAAEVAARPATVVVEGAACATPEEADRAGFDLPLGRAPFRVVVGPDYLVLLATHAFGDEWSAVSTLTHLLRQAASPEPVRVPWHEVSPARRHRLTLSQLAARPGAVLTSLRRRAELGGGPVEPASLRADRLRFTCTYVRSPEGFVTRLRDDRRARGVDVSLAALVMTGLRRAVAEHLAEPLPGAEVVYDVRRASPVSTDALGNWIAGVYVSPEDDTDARSLAQAMVAVRDRGLSLVAAAASQRPAKAGGERTVFASTGAPRLTLSYIPSHGPLQDVEFTRADGAYFGTNPPNGVDTLTLTCAEIGDRMHFGILHYDEVWSQERVRRAVAAFVADPWDRTEVTPVTRAG